VKAKMREQEKRSAETERRPPTGDTKQKELSAKEKRRREKLEKEERRRQKKEQKRIDKEEREQEKLEQKRLKKEKRENEKREKERRKHSKNRKEVSVAYSRPASDVYEKPAPPARMNGPHARPVFCQRPVPPMPLQDPVQHQTRMDHPDLPPRQTELIGQEITETAVTNGPVAQIMEIVAAPAAPTRVGRAPGRRLPTALTQ
jgi:hypothetical protein